MFCPSCNTQNRENAKFCKVCGYSFTTDAAKAGSSPGTTGDTQSATSAQDGPGIAASNPASASEVVGTQEPEAVTTSPAIPVRTEGIPEDDISLAPTQILSPQEMVAFQSRRWQHEVEREQQISGEDAAIVVPPTPVNQADATQLASPTNTIQQEASLDVASMPTVMISPKGDVAEGEPMQIPPPPPPESLHPDAEVPPESPYAQEAIAPPESVTPPTNDAETTQVANDPPVQDTSSASTQEENSAVAQPVADASSSTDNASAPAVGSIVAGRYEVTQVLSENDQEHVYQVTDHQGYQHCWNCGSEQNAEGDEFCIDCGAELLNATYLMHVYPATESKNEDAHVLQGTIVNTFVEQGQTYVIEQQQAAQVAFPNGVHLLAASDSDAGNVRRSEPNEDSTLVLQLQRVHESHSTPVGAFIVADGMGGHDNGQGASRLTISIITERLMRELLAPPLIAEKAAGLAAPAASMDEESLIALFKGAVDDANNVLCQINQQDKTDMGSTITGFMVVGDHAYIINVGDSRTYMLREGKLYQLTTDHSLVGQLVAGGLIEPDDVYTHPQRSQIFRSLGDKMNVQVDDFKQQLLPGDILISCCDGLWEMVRNPQITEILSNAHDPQTACTQLIEAANTNGGEDNVSAVVVFVR